MITGKDIELNEDGSRIVQIQSDSFTIQYKINKDNQFDPMAPIIVCNLHNTKLVASYIIEMDGTHATFHRELGKIFHEVFRAILQDPFKRLEFVHCISGIWMSCLDTIGISGKVVTFQNTLTEPHLVLRYWLIGEEWVLIYNETIESTSMIKYRDDKSMFFHQDAIMAELFGRYSDITNPEKLNGLQRQIVDDHRTVFGNKDSENERNVIMHDEMVKVQKDTSNDPMWLFNFLVQKDFVDDESIIDLIYSARTLIRRKVRNGEFDLVHPQNMNDLQHVARSRVIKVVHTILYANELAEERKCVLYMGDRCGWATYAGSAFMIELVALFSGIVYAEEAEYRCKLLASPEGICRHEALESLFHKFIDHLRDNYNLIEERYYTDFTRILKIIMIADNKE